MKSFGPLYVDVINYPIYKNYPIAEIGWTNETEEPFRKGTCLVVKPPLTHKALVLGVWGKSQEESAALSQAVEARPLDVSPEEILEW